MNYDMLIEDELGREKVRDSTPTHPGRRRHKRISTGGVSKRNSAPWNSSTRSSTKAGERGEKENNLNEKKELVKKNLFNDQMA